jgi:anti-sigma B factor antagonist
MPWRRDIPSNPNEDPTVMNSTTPLRLEGELTVYRAQELQRTLLDALAGAATLEIDLHAVTEMDSAGVQLLIAAKCAAVAADKTLRLVDHSPAVVEVFRLFDLAALFGDPPLLPVAQL